MGCRQERGTLQHAGCVGVEVKSEVRSATFEAAKLAFVALGSNLGDSVQIIQSAMDRLQQLSSPPLLRSSLWRSSPVDCPPGSPDFVNAVVGLLPATDDTPESLLDRLQALEQEFGRQPKKILNESRPLDLDLITFGTEIRNSEKLVLPHPRAHQRRFVLEPLVEVAPELVLPGQRRNAAALLASLRSDEQIERLTRRSG